MKTNRSNRLLSFFVSSSLLAITYTYAANVTWDITPGIVGVGDSALTGGTGAWNTANGNWTIDAGANNIAWDNLNNDTAVFGDTAGTVTLGTGITIGGLTFDTAGYTVAGNTLTFGTAGNIVANANATISSILAGSSAITKIGTGILTLSGSNTFSGALTVEDGTLSIASINNVSANGTLGNSATAVTLGKTGGQTGTLKYTGNTVTNTKPFTLATGGSGAFEVSTSGQSLRLDGLISGSGDLIKTGAGILILNNSSNSYTGKTIVNGGELQIGTAFNVGNLGVPGGYVAPTPVTGSNIELNGGILSYWFDFNRAIGTGAGQLQITGGTSGFTQKQGDRTNLTFNTAATLINWGSATFSPTVLVLNDAGAARDITFNNLLNLNGGDRTIATNNATWFATMNNVISNSTGTAGLIKTGVGELRLGQANSFNGVVTVNQGTLTVTGNFANGGSNSALGASSNAASNLLLANGTTLKYTGGAISTNRSFTINGTAAGHGASLDASGSGAVNFTSTSSPAFGTNDQTRTLTLTGTNTGNNILAANLADNGTGAVSVTKTGAGLWVLSGTSSSYTGPTTLNAGTLSASAVANLGAASSNLVFNGGTFQPTGGTFLNFSSIGHTVVFNSGQRVGLDIPSGTFTADQVLNQGTGGLTKAGAGTLVIDTAHTYTGTTIISGGTIQFGSGTAAGSLNTISGINVASGATFAVNQSNTVTQGTDFGSQIIGAGSLANLGSGTLVLNAPTSHTGNTTPTVGNITLGSALAIRNSALNTTGAGFVTLGVGITTPTFGGLSNTGTTRNLADVITTGYGSVTNLTLNPASGVTHTYGGVIADGATGMTLTKTGAGTQTLTGANTYTGATTINQGTLNLGGATVDGSLASTVLNLTGGTLSYTRTGTNTQSFTTTNITAGASTVTTSVATQTVALNSIVRSVGSTVNFGTTGVTSTSNSTTNGILGGWATTNNDNWATLSGSNIVALGSYTTGDASAATYTNANINVATVTVGGTIDTNSLRFSGSGAKTLTLAAGDNIIQSSGILVRSDVGNFGSAITGGNLAGSSGGDLIIHNHNTNANGALTISSLIKNNTSATALTKSGAGTLILNNTANSYSGGTFVNAGTLTFGATGSWVSGQNLTFGGAATVTVTAGTITGGTLNLLAGSTGIIAGSSSLTFTSTTGTGTIIYGGGNGPVLNIGNASGLTGNALVAVGSGGTNPRPTLRFSTMADTAGSVLGWGGAGQGDSNQRAQIELNDNAGALTFNNRQLAVLPRTSGNNMAKSLIFGNNNSNAAHTWTINTDFLNNADRGGQTLIFEGSNTGNNQFAGDIGDSTVNSAALNVAKTGTGKWIISGDNTFTGRLIVSQGTLSVGTLNETNVAGPLSMNNNIQLGGDERTAVGGNSTEVRLSGSNSGTLEYTGGTVNSTRSFFIGDNAAANTGGGTIANNGTGAITFSAATFNPTQAGITATRTLGLGGSNTAANAVQGVIQNNNTAGGGLIALTKADAGRWILSGTNTYTGATTINAGVLQAADGTGLPTTSILQLRGGVFQSSGTFTRAVSTASGAVNWSTSSGGFAAIGGTLNLQLNGGTSSLTWHGTSMVSTGQTLIFGSTTADNLVDFQNALNLGSSGSGQRTIQVNDNTGSANDLARISGQITNTAAGWGIIKTGTGLLELTNASNTYTGVTTVSQGTLALVGAGLTSAITVSTGASLGFTLGSTASNSSTVNLTNGTVKITGTPTLASYTLMTTSGITGTPVLDSPIAGYALVVDGTDLKLNSTGGGDMIPPTLTSITDNVGGGPVNIGATVTYTVTFDEDMNDATVTTADFGNNGTAVATIDSVTETTPGVFSVVATPTSPGTLVLRINALAVLEDVAGNDLDTDPALLDDTTITVRNAYQTWALTNAISSAPGADKDGDGVNNAIEFLLGGDVSTNDLSKLPEVTTTATDMIFIFERKRSSIDGITGCTIEVGTTLTGWPTTYTVGSNTAGSTAGVVVTENSPAGFDTITLTVPIGSDPKKFARLKANVTE